MTVKFCDNQYECSVASCDTLAGTVDLYSADGRRIFHAEKVTDFSLFVLDGGTWCDSAESGSPTPTLEQRLAALEAVQLEQILGGAV